ncbi:hypothetical protein F444_19659 [Phytophthora nicotianae P1976]|uniref:Uncharacterized protein n=1 Tax=Phytophthora nicotianae P1976 TaxID=1317066 RepID=A0A080Z719_PHYNI|nr:hypothetical protein F444_19659 [Phytophthora nicotianae P1976]
MATVKEKGKVNLFMAITAMISSDVTTHFSFGSGVISACDSISFSLEKIASTSPTCLVIRGTNLCIDVDSECGRVNAWLWTSSSETLRKLCWG